MSKSPKPIECSACDKIHFRHGKLCGTCYNKDLFNRSENYRDSLEKYNTKRSELKKLKNKVKFNCIICDNEFFTGRKWQKKCAECILLKNFQFKKTPVSFSCIMCGQEFNKKRRKQVNCSTKCYSKYYGRIRDREKKNFYERVREARLRGADGNFSHSDWLEILDKHFNKCAICSSSHKKLTIDHIIPISKGGTNFKENIQPLCVSCNSSKNNKIYDKK